MYTAREAVSLKNGSTIALIEHLKCVYQLNIYQVFGLFYLYIFCNNSASLVNNLWLSKTIERKPYFAAKILFFPIVVAILLLQVYLTTRFRLKFVF